MSADKTGGPVFPSTHNGSTLPGGSGMTLRDYMAVHAMQSYIAIYRHGVASGEEWIAVHSYQMADAMLKVRSSS